jgi:hypothetical protein
MKRNTDEIEPSMQNFTTVSATQVPHSLSKILRKKMEKLLSLWVDDLNKKKVPLTRGIMTPRSRMFNERTLLLCLH